MNFVEITWTLVAGAVVAGVVVAKSRESSVQVDPIPVRVNRPESRGFKS
ncbi:MAG: hypothetical protein ACKO5P_05535 [Nodosilinea sp.]